jgi:hypothetical protein
MSSLLSGCVVIIVLVSWVRLAVARCKILAVTGHRLFSANPTKPTLLSEIRRPRLQLQAIMVKGTGCATIFSHPCGLHASPVDHDCGDCCSHCYPFGMNFAQRQFFVF